METNQYSEQDIQDYAAGKFNGDISNFEAYVKKYPAVSQQVKKYQDLFSLLNEETMPSLSFNLADKVIAKIQQRGYTKEAPKFNLLPYVLMIITGFAFFITSQYLDVKQIFSSSVSIGLFLTAAAIMILFFTGFYFVEIKQKQKRFTSY
jgi:hypothetical protein